MPWLNRNRSSATPRTPLAKRSIACAAVIALASCNSIVADGCTIFGPIHGSKLDTPETRTQVDEHNAKGVGACGWRRGA